MQPGAVVIFDGGHCNFFSSNDAYAFHRDGDKYVLDVTDTLGGNVSQTVSIVNKNKTSKKTVSKLKTKKKYYVRIRTYKNVKVNGQTTRLYSSWSKVKTVVTKANQRTKTKTVGTAKLTAKNKEARKAYQAVLREGQHIQMSYRQVKYALIDLDSDGIDELFIEILGSSASVYTFPVYTFKGGRAIKLIENPHEGFVVYTDGTFCSVYGMAGYGENKYYKIKNGSLEKLLEMEGNNNLFGSTGVKWYLTKIGNKNALEAACQKWIKKFESLHKQLTLSYKDNTDENRNSMINKK